MDELRHKLERPFPINQIHWRVGPTNQRSEARKQNNKNAKATKGQVLAYIDARDVMKRLDEVFGVMGWSATYPRDGYCEITVYHGDRITTKGNYGTESQMEKEKGQASDAFKRAAVLLGVGRYLYKLHAPWVDLDEWGKFSKADIPQLPAWATPEGYDDLIKQREK